MVQMKRSVMLALALALAACNADAPPERYGFVARLGRDTVSVERITEDENGGDEPGEGGE